MKITEIRLGSISVPLRVPFKTALRTVTRAAAATRAPPPDIAAQLQRSTSAVRNRRRTARLRERWYANHVLDLPEEGAEQ